MKKDTLLTVMGLSAILAAGFIVFLIPYKKADERNAEERAMIEEYLAQYSDEEKESAESVDTEPGVDETVDYLFSDVDSNAYRGEIDSILVINKINLKKAIIRGNNNDYNLDRYYFVTADQEAVLGEDNYIIYGHCSQTYGHSFNRLEELKAGDKFQLIQEAQTFTYVVSDVRRELREDAAPYLDTGMNTVQFLSCEKKRESGYSEKRLIIVTAQRSFQE